MGVMEVDMVVMVLVAVMIVDMMLRRGMAMCGGDGLPVTRVSNRYAEVQV